MLDNLATVLDVDAEFSEDEQEFIQYAMSFMEAYAAYPTCAESSLQD